ncbi:MAG: hypothetical protein ACRDA5_00850 [Clostridium sp.]
MSNYNLALKEAAEKIEYTKDEIKDLENRVIFRRNNIAAERYFLADEYEIRKKTYCRMLSTVEAKLDSDEEIFVSKINIPSRDGTGGLSICVYYQGLFFTNKRIFNFNMNFRYEELEKLEINSIQDITCLKGKEDLDGVRIEFKNTNGIFIKSYSKDEKELTLIIIKHILEKGVDFSKKSKLIDILFG